MTVTTLEPRLDEAVAGDGAGGRPDAPPAFMPGDIIFFAGRGISTAGSAVDIMRSPGEEGPTYAVHTAQFIDAGRYIEIDMVGKVRATRDIRQKSGWRAISWTRRGFEVGGLDR